MRLWLISLSLMGTALASPDASPYPMPYPMAAPYPMERKRHFGTHKEEEMNFGGFPAYDKIPYEKRIPAMVRSADVAEDRQGGGGGGFSAPAFSIPFQPNFNFNEFSSPFGSDGSFSQFLSGLGNQGNLGQASPFLQQTEQRFTRPQTPTGPFKRQVEPSSDYRQPPARYNSARSQPLEPIRPEPVYRPETYRNPQVHQKPAQAHYRQPEPERRQRVQPVYRPSAYPEAREAVVEVESFPKPDFPDLMNNMEMSDMADFDLDFEPNKEPSKFQSQAKHMENHRVEEERRRSQNRRIQEEEEKEREAEEQRRRREEQERRRKVQEEQERRRRIQEERTRMMEKKEEMKRTQQAAQQRDRFREPTNQARFKESSDPSKKDFSPPTLIEKFQQPIIKSEPFTFEVPSSPTPSPFTNFKPEQPQSVKVASTKKPVFQYEKKNFREPVKAQARAQSPHPLIRIKPKHHSASPRPQLMSDGQRGQVKGKQLHSGGFQPFRPPMNPNPGKMEVVEVGRQGEPIVFDNDQEIITAPKIVKNNKNSFSVDVVASFAPQGSRGRPQQRKGKVQNGSTVRRVERRRSVHLPRPVPLKRGRSLNFEPVQRNLESSSREEVVPYFESVR